MKAQILNFTEIGLDVINSVGLKNAYLGEIYNNLYGKGIKAVPGFAITTSAFKYFKEYNGLDTEISEIIGQLDTDDFSNLSHVSLLARKRIINSRFPKDLENAIITSYENIFSAKDCDVAVRSSVTNLAANGEMPESYLNISGSIALLYAIKSCYACLYSENALRTISEDGNSEVEISVGIQQMVRADLACSGTANTSHNNITIKGSWGLGQDFASKLITQDEFIVTAENPESGISDVNSKTLGSKSRMLVYNDLAAGTNSTVSKSTPGELREQYILSEADILALSHYASAIKQYFKTDVHIEWAKDGTDGNIYIVQVQPYVG